MLPSRQFLSPLAAAVIGICVTLVAATCTAHASHLAAQGGWPPPLDLSQSGDETSRGPDLAMDDNGDLHMIWMERAGVTFTVYHAGSDDQGSNWTYSDPMTTSASGNDRVEAAMDVDAYGLVHTVWVERFPAGDHQLWYALLSGDSWEEMAMITQTNYVTYIVAPDVVATPDFVHALWSETNAGAKRDVFYSRSEAGGAWSPATCTVETSFSSQYPRVAADPDGNLHVVWEENNKSPAAHEVYYISGTVYTTGTVWSVVPITVSAGLTQTATTPDIVVGSDNVVHVVFGVNVVGQQYVQDIYYASFPVTDAGIVSATLIPGSRVKVSQQLPTFASPAVALFGDGQVHVVWNGWRAGDYSDSDRIYYAVSGDGGLSWSKPLPVSPRDSWPDGFPSLAADETFVHLVWQEKVSGLDQDVYYTRRFPIWTLFPLGLKEF
jgi:hypothetical protein